MNWYERWRDAYDQNEELIRWVKNSPDPSESKLREYERIKMVLLLELRKRERRAR